MVFFRPIPSMPRLVFDIETTAQPLENFDEVQQEYLLRDAEKLPEEAAKAAKREEITRMFSLWPLTAQVVCIAMLNAESQRGQVLFLAEDYEDEAEAGPVEFVPCADETELLTAFWDVARHYDEARQSHIHFPAIRTRETCDPASQAPSMRPDCNLHHRKFGVAR